MKTQGTNDENDYKSNDDNKKESDFEKYYNDREKEENISKRGYDKSSDYFNSKHAPRG